MQSTRADLARYAKLVLSGSGKRKKMPLSKIVDSKKRILEYLILALILILATVLSCYRIAEPAWDDTHGKAPLDGFHGSVLIEYGRIAQDYVKFGYLRTRLGRVTSYGWVEPSESLR